MGEIMADNNEIDDVTRMLIDIQKDVSSTKAQVEDIKSQLNQFRGVEDKADKALAKSIENQHAIKRINRVQNWLIALLFSGGVMALLIYVAEKFL